MLTALSPSTMTCKTQVLIRGLADIVFPPRCTLCGSMIRQGRPVFCLTCLSGITAIGSPLCTVCGLPFADSGGTDHLCGDCIASPPPFRVARALGVYEAALLDAIHLFKYNGNMTVGKELGRMMAACDYNAFDIGAYSLVVPVPLHPRRLRKRGFNQALVLARQIGHRFSVPLDFTTLIRDVDTGPQVNLGKSERDRNVRGAFAVTRRDTIDDRKVLLVDDVYTTGSTVRECAGALRAGGAREVAVLTLARA